MNVTRNEITKKNLEAEVSGNALVKRLQNELQNITETLEKKELETSDLYTSVTKLN
jgi:hypothetical protein